MAERKKLKGRFIGPVSPYEIAIYLQEVEKIDWATQRPYRDIKAGKLAAKQDKDGKWRVEPEEATRYCLWVINRPKGRKRNWVVD